jgi:hypothetical protein
MLARSLMLAAAIAVAPAASAGSSRSVETSAQPEWRREFETVCAKTQDAMELSLEELRSLVARCDKLKPVIEQLGETERKVYSRRLKGCRDLYAFMLETRERG